MQIPFIKGDSVDDNVDYRDALPVNMYAINRDILGAKGYMINFFGLSDYANGVNVDRGAIWVSLPSLEGHYRVSGSCLLRIDKFGNTEDLGTIPGSSQVSMAYSFNNLAIVASGKLYYYNEGQGLREITDADVGSPIDIDWVNSKFFLTDGESIYTSNVADEEEYESLDFANAEFMPDSSRGVSKNEDNEMMVFGAFSVEYFVDIGADNFPFQRIPNKAQKIGILGTHCKAEMNGRFYTLSRRKETSPSFHIISLGSEQSISTRETDKILDTYTEEELESTTIDAFVRDNIKLVVFHLPNDTLMFNETIADIFGIPNAWTILKTDVLGNNTFRAKNFIRDPRNAKWITGDKIDGRIGILDESVATHYDEIVEWILSSPFIPIESLSVDKLEVQTIPGVTADNTPSTAVQFSTASAVSQIHSFGPSDDIDFIAGTTYTFSAFVKNNGVRYVAISLPEANFNVNSNVSFDLVGGVVGNNSGSNQAYIQPFSNDWFRVSVVLTCISSGSTKLSIVGVVGGGTSLTTTGDGTGCFASRVQTEVGTVPSKATKTVGLKRGNNITIYSDNINFWENETDTTMVSNGIGPMLLTDDATVGISFTVDGRTHSNEFFELYGDKSEYNQRFYVRRLGYVRHWIGIKLRGASRSRMAFANLNIEAS